MYRDDLAATHARVEALQRELGEAQAQKVNDQQKIAALSSQLQALQAQVARLSAAGAPWQQPQVPLYTLPSRGSTVLVLGVLSLVACAVLGPIAWSMGNEEMRRIDCGMTPPFGRGQVQAGRICGIISSCLLCLGLAWFLFATMVVLR